MFVYQAHLIIGNTYVASFWKTGPAEGQNTGTDQTSDQNLNFLSHMSIYKNTRFSLSAPINQLKTKYLMIITDRAKAIFLYSP